MPTRSTSLRTLLSVITAVVSAIALIVSTFLVVITAQLRGMAATQAESVESLLLLDRIKSDLLAHGRSHDASARQTLADRLRREYVDMNQHVSTPREAFSLRDAVAANERYLANETEPLDQMATSLLLENSYAKVQALMDINADQARDARADAIRLSRFADRLGLGLGVLVLALAIGVLGWLRSRAFAPLLGLAHAMDRFEDGDHEARAPENGAIELQAMARRFNAMADSIARRRREQIAFLGGVAHDLRNPLAALRLTTRTLGPGHPLPEEDEIRHVVERIDRQLASLERMVGDFIDTASVESGQLELRLEHCDLRPIVEQGVELFQASRGDRFVLVLPDHEVPARCDPVRLEQVLTNLLSNAVKYSPPDSRITITLGCNGAGAVLAVADQGVGIAPEDQRRLFDPFRRTGMSRGAFPGVGLGLFVVRRIVQAHGGRIEIDSAPGHGSTFRVRLPAEQNACD
jgi:signal transduction histidine kinase